MHRLPCALVLCSLLPLLMLSSVQADGEFEFEKGVLVLTEANFDEAVAQFDTLMVEFHAPWCGACKAMEPEYAKAAQLLLKRRSPVKLAKVDVTVEKQLREKYDIRGYPTLKLFKDGIPTECHDVSSADEIVRWLDKKLGPPCEQLSSPADAKKLAASKDVTMIGFFRHAGSSAAQQYERAAFYDAGSLACGITSGQEVFADFGVDKDTVVLFNNLDSKVVHFTGPFSFERLREFLRNNRLPAVAELNSENRRHLLSGDGPTGLLFVRRRDNEAEFLEALGHVRPAALKFKDKIRFAFVDPDGEEGVMATIFKVTDDELPALAIMDGRKKFRLQFADLSADSAEAFVAGVLSGSARPYLRSELAPADWSQRPVQLLVGSNFNEVARNASTNALVNLCIRRVPKCQEVSGVLQSLGQFYRGDDSVLVAELDIFDNDIEGIELRRLPTIKFFPAFTNQVVDYDGELNLEALKNFVESNKRVRKDRRRPKREEL